MKISTIIFDLGKVLVDFDFQKCYQNVRHRTSLAPEEILSAFHADSLALDYELGNIATPDFFQELQRRIQFQGTLQELEEIWCNIFTPINEHIEYARILAVNYPLAILSNTDEAHIRFLEARHDFFDWFQEKVYSFNVHMRKPQAEIYLETLDRMNANPYETLFIDDLEENIQPPSKMGWQTIHLRPEVSLKLALQSYDLKGIV